MTREWFMVAMGGALGTLGRHALNQFSQQVFGAGFPAGTLAANVVGCLLAGIGWSVVSSQGWSNSPWDIAFRVGFLGGLTTFSAYSLEVFRFSHDGKWGLALVVLLTNILLGFSAVAIGFGVTQWILGIENDNSI